MLDFLGICRGRIILGSYHLAMLLPVLFQPRCTISGAGPASSVNTAPPGARSYLILTAISLTLRAVARCPALHARSMLQRSLWPFASCTILRSCAIGSAQLRGLVHWLILIGKTWWTAWSIFMVRSLQVGRSHCRYRDGNAYRI